MNYYRETIRDDELDALDEFLLDDCVASRVKYVHFVSKSKGRRNGKQRRRRHWKEVELIKYTNGWHLSRNFEWDVYCTEIFGMSVAKEEAEQALRDAVPVVCRG